ncbi:hypothetical protein FOA52_004489 [Chlamydomonas sp. UWO 241]|nr:hypothetical protein FOA52_004489 [Chlamydomonas sp. UWO 241]
MDAVARTTAQLRPHTPAASHQRPGAAAVQWAAVSTSPAAMHGMQMRLPHTAWRPHAAGGSMHAAPAGTQAAASTSGRAAARDGSSAPSSVRGARCIRSVSASGSGSRMEQTRALAVLLAVPDYPAVSAAVTSTQQQASSGRATGGGSGGPPGPNSNEPDKDRLEYFANVGDAIRTLREDIPKLFERDINYEIYRFDVVFCDERDGKSIAGVDKYKTLFWSLRFHGGLLFSACAVDVLRIWQPEDCVIKMRWTVRATPRVPLPWGSSDTAVLDGVSTYKLDRTGKIKEHSVNNVQLRDPPIALSPLALLSLNLNPVQQPAGNLGSGSW